MLQRFLTPAERRLGLLFFGLTLLGWTVRGTEKLSPEIQAWLDSDSPVPAPAPAPALADSGTEPPPGPRQDRHPSSVANAPSHQDPQGVDPNTAGLEELMSLPGVGPVLAARIVEYRERNGRFEGVSGLLEVPGIGPATLKRMEEFLVWDQ